MNSLLNTSPILLSLLLFACGGDKPAAPGAPANGMPPPEVEVITVALGKATYTQDLPGRVQAYRTAQVRARVDGVVEQRLFREGSEVKAGASLFRIDARSYLATAEAARAEAALASKRVHPCSVSMRAVIWRPPRLPAPRRHLQIRT